MEPETLHPYSYTETAEPGSSPTTTPTPLVIWGMPSVLPDWTRSLARIWQPCGCSTLQPGLPDWGGKSPGFHLTSPSNLKTKQTNAQSGNPGCSTLQPGLPDWYGKSPGCHLTSPSNLKNKTNPQSKSESTHTTFVI